MEWSEAAQTCYANYRMNSIPVNKKWISQRKYLKLEMGFDVSKVRTKTIKANGLQSSILDGWLL